MTKPKREPFARSVALRYSAGGGQTYAVEVFGFKIAGNFNESGALLRAMEINARVDEEIEKVVNPLRAELRRLLDVVEDHWSIFTALGENTGTALPTEPERGKA